MFRFVGSEVMAGAFGLLPGLLLFPLSARGGVTIVFVAEVFVFIVELFVVVFDVEPVVVPVPPSDLM